MSNELLEQPSQEWVKANVSEVVPFSVCRIDQLRRIELFSATPLPDLNKIANLLEEVYIKANQTIFKKGELGHCMYIIIAGRVRIHDGRQIINDLEEQDIFGEMSLLDSTPRLASAITLLDTRLWRLNQIDFYHLMNEQIEVTRGIIKILSRRLRERILELLKLPS